MKSLEAEHSVIGAILLTGLEAAESIYRLNNIGADLFTDELCKSVYRAIQSLSADQQQIDVVTVGNAINATPEIRSQLTAWMEWAPSSSNTSTSAYIGILEKHYQSRKLSDLSVNIAYQIDDGIGPEQVIDSAQDYLLSLVQSKAGGLVDMKAIMKSVVSQTQARFENGATVWGDSTPWPTFNQKAGGLHGGKLIVVAGRPGMGKSIFGANLAEHESLTRPTIVFTLEMEGEELGLRMVAAKSGIDLGQLNSGQVEEWERFGAAATQLASNDKLEIDSTPGIMLSQIQSRAKSFKLRKGDLGLIVIDHVGLMRYKDKDRREGLSEISRGLKRLAKELDCTVVALQQLGRQVEQRTDKRPMLSDLRDTGSLEEDADMVLFCYRDEYYYPDTKYPGIAEIICSKHRGGPQFTIFAKSDLARSRFPEISNYTPPAEEEPSQGYGFK